MSDDFDWGDRIESPLQDNDLMPFGKFKGKQMSDVSGRYLMWLLEQDWLKERYPSVYAYIMNNIEAVEIDAEEEARDEKLIYPGSTHRELEPDNLDDWDV